MNSSKRSLAALGAIAAAVIASGCQKSAAGADPGAIATAIKADEKKWSDEFQAKPRSVDALVAHYAHDALFISPGVGPTRGLEDIRKAYEAGLKDPNFNITFAPDTVDVAEAGDMAVSEGRFTETYSDPATKRPKSDNGTFLTVYRKQPDGSWKAVQDWAVADPAG